MVKRSQIARMIYDVLNDNDTLYNMVDGEIYLGLPEESVQDHLSNSHETCISITFGNWTTTGTQGSATSKIKDIIGEVQIDVGSLYNNSDLYCHDVTEAIEDLTFFDVDTSLGDSEAYMFVMKEPGKVFYDNNIKAYHGILILSLNYRTIGT